MVLPYALTVVGVPYAGKYVLRKTSIKTNEQNKRKNNKISNTIPDNTAKTKTIF